MDENKKIEYGVFHTHTDGSTKDSALSVDRLVERCNELGAKAIALTDHGVMTNTFNFLKRCESAGIKGVPGVEAYVKGIGSVLSRAHMIIVAKDAVGLSAIYKAVSESYAPENIEDGFPHMDLDTLRKYMGPGTEGHGHVIATSACVGGPLALILLNNTYAEQAIFNKVKKQKEYDNPSSVTYKELLAHREEKLAQIKKMVAERERLTALSKRTFTKREKTINALQGTERYAQAKAELDDYIKETAQAKMDLIKIREAIASMSKEKTSINGKIKDMEKDHAKWNLIQNDIESLRATIRSDTELNDDAKKLAVDLEGLFGKGNFYIELQYHGIDKEAEVMPKLAKIADEFDLPTIAANDVHIATNSENDLLSRQIIRSMRYNKWEERNVGDDQLYVKTDYELEDMLRKILPDEAVKKAMRGIGDLFGACNYIPAKEEHYPIFRSEIPGEDAKIRLRRLAYEGIKKRYPNEGDWTEAKADRLEYELNTIGSMGFSDYLCIVEDFIKYGKEIALKNPECVGFGVGPGRGSAAGSLVCYLIGITSVDPCKYDLLFERFLNEERVSMPDIDTDFHTQIRSRVIEYVRDKYGRNAICNIVTKSRLGVRGSIRNRARLLGSERYGDISAYNNLADEIAKSVPKKPGIKFKDCYDELISKFKNNPDAIKIIDDACLIEGVTVTYGMHAAGVVIADNGNVSEYIPLMYDCKKNSIKSQFDMNEIEEVGLLKMDFLGLKNLDIVSNTMRKIKRRHGISVDPENLPFEDKVFQEIYAKGLTNAVFQFESPGMKQMLREFKPDKFEDIILLIAAYRPGPMQFISDIIEVKHGCKVPEYAIPEMAEILGETYGYPIYQEQVMQIFNRFAGFSLGKADIIRRYMSKKKEEEFLKYKDDFIQGMINSGAMEDKALELWEQLVDFAKYAFNKSHATAYALVSYITAWLKYHYPAEYISSLIDYIKTDEMQKKMPGLISDCKRVGIKILQPDINQSEIGFSIQGNNILFGLSSVKNVGAAAEAIIEARSSIGRFTSFYDFLINGHVRKDVTEFLIRAGAFDNMFNNRQALLAVFNSVQDMLKKLSDKRKILAAEGEDTKKGKNAQEAVNKILAEIEAIKPIEGYPEDKLERLNEEKELLGAYISAHPLDEYKSPAEMGCTPIDELASGTKARIMGLITNLKLVQRKADGLPMAFFVLEDLTGSIEVNCYTKSFSGYGDFVREEGKVVILEGKVYEEEVISSVDDEEEDSNDDDTVLNVVLKLNMYTAKIVEPELPKIILYTKHLFHWDEELQHKVKAYRTGKGNPLVLYDSMMGQYRETEWKVSPEIMKSGLQVSMM